MGETLDAAAFSGLGRPDRDRQARRSYAAAVNEIVSRGWCARSLAIARSISLICDLWGFAFSWTRREPIPPRPSVAAVGLERKAPPNVEKRRPMFSHRALRRDAIWCSVSEACWMSGLREYGYAGLRDA